jgi:hypothetical protein
MTTPASELPLPLSAAEVADCQRRGQEYSGVWCLEENGELHLVGPPAASRGRRIPSIGLTVLGAAGLGSAGMNPQLEVLVIGGLGGVACLCLAWALFAETYSSWTLRLTPDGCVHDRFGRWFPYGKRILRVSRRELGEMSQRVIHGGTRGLRVRLAGHEVDLRNHPTEDARQLAERWERVLAGDRSGRLPDPR